MRLIAYVIGMLMSCGTLGYLYVFYLRTDWVTYYLAGSCILYIIYSTIAFAALHFRRNRNQQSWALFSLGFLTISAFLPLARIFLERFYFAQLLRPDRSYAKAMEDIMFISPLIVGSCLVAAGIINWSTRPTDSGTSD